MWDINYIYNIFNTSIFPVLGGRVGWSADRPSRKPGPAHGPHSHTRTPQKMKKTHQPGTAPAHTPPHAPRREANGLAPAPEAFRLTLISHNNDWTRFFYCKIRHTRTHTLNLYAQDGHQRIGCKVYATHAHIRVKPTKAVGIKRSFEYAWKTASRGTDLKNLPNR